MELSSATEALSALAHETRLAVFQLVIKEGPEGLRAGEIARRMNVQPSTLSGHLNALRRAQLLSSRREQQQIYYSANIEGTKKLINFLTQDCCGGHPEICEGLVDGRKCGSGAAQ